MTTPPADDPRRCAAARSDAPTSATPERPSGGSRANWAGSYRYRAARLHRPRSVEELQQIVTGASSIRPLGSRHSFNGIADTDGDQVSMDAMEPAVDIDSRAATATVAAGMRYAEVAERLHRAGFALRAMASLPHISVAGACATGTHGSGNGAGSLAADVTAIEFVDGRGELRALSRAGDPADFPGAVVGLGALGVLTRLTLQLIPTFQVAQTAFLDLPLPVLLDGFDHIFAAAYSVSCFTRFRGDRVDQVWFKARTDPAPDRDQRDGDLSAVLPGARPATAQMHPVPGHDGASCTVQGGVPGPWHERLPHFRIGFVPSSGDELQSEYLVPRADAVPAVRALWALGERMAPVLRVAEIRTIAADDLWLSPAYRQDTVAFHFTWSSDWEAVTSVLPGIEDALAPFGAVPHWGKVFSSEPAVFRRRYQRLADFGRLARSYDPDGRFRNEFLNRYVLPASS